MPKIAPTVSASSFPIANREAVTWAVARTAATTLPQCGCESETLRAVRIYLREHFPGWAVRDFHEHTRLVRVGVPDKYGDHHLVSVTDWERAYYAVLPNTLFARPLPDLRLRLHHWQLAERLRAHAIVIVSRAGITAL